jgi:protein tyrosine phosphatase (PTP) superfamily phosphohydrolase (DUF442 family)
MRISTAISTLLAASLALIACRSSEDVATGELRSAQSSVVAPSLSISGSAYEFAGEVQLPEQLPEESTGLYNIFHLSESIVSGSEPHGRAGLEALAEMGIKTIISVDGKLPDAETAAELGMRYVHVPIQYKGISDDEMLRLSKAFRELPEPFYVHCFHGRHRGPAGAAVGRVVRDGLTRDLAIAEMRQYSGTSSKYEGLYQVIASGEIPSPEATAASDCGFETAHRPNGMVGVMVEVSRAHDNVAMLSERNWKLDPEHPDVDAVNEAEKLRDAYATAVELSEVQNGPSDLREWFEESLEVSNQLVSELKAERAGQSAASDLAVQSFLTIKADCKACHKSYRNE